MQEKPKTQYNSESARILNLRIQQKVEQVKSSFDPEKDKIDDLIWGAIACGAKTAIDLLMERNHL